LGLPALGRTSLTSRAVILAKQAARECELTGPRPAGIDPIVMVDPALTAGGDYVLTMSEGLAPSAPEPGTWIMAALGFAAIGSFAARRRMGAPARATG
jgi:PEP-CTERM motif